MLQEPPQLKAQSEIELEAQIFQATWLPVAFLEPSGSSWTHRELPVNCVHLFASSTRVMSRGHHPHACGHRHCACLGLLLSAAQLPSQLGHKRYTKQPGRRSIAPAEATWVNVLSSSWVQSILRFSSTDLGLTEGLSKAHQLRRNLRLLQYLELA